MQGTTVTIPARDLGETLRASLAGAVNTFLSTIPRLLGFAIVLVAGWVVSSLLAKGVVVLLQAMKFNELARRSGFADFVQSMGVRTDSAGVIAGLAKWFVRVFALVVAFDLLGLPAVSNVLQRFLLWLPNLIVGLVVLVIGGVAAHAVSRLVRGAVAQAGLTNPEVIATVAKVAVWAFAIVVAVSQLGIATTLINTLLVGVVGALALATGLAFGLGGREHAARLLQRLGPPAQAAAPRIERPAGTRRGET
ncbi:MAG: mechanosensitive ion channel family protein, partial [Gemmatimonadales bacterium]